MKKIDCRNHDVVCWAKCMGVDRNSKTCKSFYPSKTSRCIGERFKDHIEKYQAQSDASVFCLHCKDKHYGILQQLEISVECKGPSDAMFRQISEAAYIERENLDLHKRSEWGNRFVPWHQKKNKGISNWHLHQYSQFRTVIIRHTDKDTDVVLKLVRFCVSLVKVSAIMCKRKWVMLELVFLQLPWIQHSN